MTADGPDHSRAKDDLVPWRGAVAGDQLRLHEPGAVLQAFWKARMRRDERLESALACHLSDVVVRILAKVVKSSFPDGGRELADEVHFKIMEAIFDPASADGRALSEHFEARVHFRFLDAVRRQRRRQQVELPLLAEDDGSLDEGEDSSAMGGFGSVEVGHALSLIKDERKRLAFTMTMANHPKGEIAEMLGIDPKTLYLWLREVREFLKTELNL